MKQRHIHAQISRSSDKFEEDEAPIPLARKVLKNCFRRRSTRRYLSYRMKNLEQSNQRDFDVVGPRAPAALSFHNSGSRGGKLKEQQRGYSTAALRDSRLRASFSLPATLLRGEDSYVKVINMSSETIMWPPGEVLPRANSCEEPQPNSQDGRM
ncbi:uncharacterized protein LOC134201675 [Bombyx mori]|uniref:uncharacterized protein LOC134201675 n=1 Tax=Bombyx mori TaxID=7091 RepID=UPI002ED091C2